MNFFFLYLVGFSTEQAKTGERYPYYGVPSVIAVNMILSGASGGITAIVIATWAQVCCVGCVHIHNSVVCAHGMDVFLYIECGFSMSSQI